MSPFVKHVVLVAGAAALAGALSVLATVPELASVAPFLTAGALYLTSAFVKRPADSASK